MKLGNLVPFSMDVNIGQFYENKFRIEERLKIISKVLLIISPHDFISKIRYDFRKIKETKLLSQRNKIISSH